MADEELQPQQTNPAPEPSAPAEPLPSQPDPQLVEWLERGAPDNGEKR